MFRTVAIVVIVFAPNACCFCSLVHDQIRSAACLFDLIYLLHGANHCWDATPGGRRYSVRHQHHYVRHHHDEDQVVQVRPRPPSVIQVQPQPVEEPTALPMLTPADLIRAGHTMMIGELELNLNDRWPDTNMEFQAKPLLIESAIADAPSIVSVRIVILSIGVVLVICTVLVGSGLRCKDRAAAT